MIDLTQFNKEELNELLQQVFIEIGKKEAEEFPYKKGNCFFRIAPSSMGKGIEVCRIEDIGNIIQLTMLTFDACNNVRIYASDATPNTFIKLWKTPIDPKIFDLYKEMTSKINTLQAELVHNVFQLSKEYDNKGN